MEKLHVLEDVWYVAALAEELTATPIARTICGFPMVLYRGESGRPVALEDRCPHRQAPLSMGNVRGDQIQCRSLLKQAVTCAKNQSAISWLKRAEHDLAAN